MSLPDPLQEEKRDRYLLFGGILPGAVLGFFGSLIESSMKAPFKFAFSLTALVQNEFLAKGFSTLWFGISHLKLFYVLTGILILMGATVVLLLGAGLVIGAFIGGALYWLLSHAQP